MIINPFPLLISFAFRSTFLGEYEGYMYMYVTNKSDVTGMYTFDLCAKIVNKITLP